MTKVLIYNILSRPSKDIYESIPVELDWSIIGRGMRISWIGECLSSLPLCCRAITLMESQRLLRGRPTTTPDYPIDLSLPVYCPELIELDNTEYFSGNSVKTLHIYWKLLNLAPYISARINPIEIEVIFLHGTLYFGQLQMLMSAIWTFKEFHAELCLRMSLMMPLPPPWGNSILPEYNIYLLPKNFDNRYIPLLSMIAGSFYINLCLHQLQWRGILQDIPLHKFMDVFKWYKILIVPIMIQNSLIDDIQNLQSQGRKISMTEVLEGSCFTVNSYQIVMNDNNRKYLNELSAIIRPLVHCRIDNVQNTENILDDAIAFIGHRLYDPPLNMSDWV
jgi:hypothetical protein